MTRFYAVNLQISKKKLLLLFLFYFLKMEKPYPLDLGGNFLSIAFLTSKCINFIAEKFLKS